jgi:hypothetical protein
MPAFFISIRASRMVVFKRSSQICVYTMGCDPKCPLNRAAFCSRAICNAVFEDGQIPPARSSSPFARQSCNLSESPPYFCSGDLMLRLMGGQSKCTMHVKSQKQFVFVFLSFFFSWSRQRMRDRTRDMQKIFLIVRPTEDSTWLNTRRRTKFWRENLLWKSTEA